MKISFAVSIGNFWEETIFKLFEGVRKWYKDLYISQTLEKIQTYETYFSYFVEINVPSNYFI